MKPHLLALAACVAASTASHAQPKQEWPTRAIRIVVAFPAGSPGDTAARIVADAVGQSLKQPVIIENRPGAGGNIGAEAVARSPADGYTFLEAPDTVVTINPAIYRKLNFTADDLTPVVALANFNQMLVCSPATGLRTLAQLDAQARKTPGALSYASGGQGVPGHLAMELYLSGAGLDILHVPYKGPSPATQDVLAGQVPCGYLASPVVAPYVAAGKLYGLAVSGSARSVQASDVPTMQQAGVAGYDATFREMLFAPKGTPAAIVQRMNEEVVRALALPEVKQKLQGNDLDPQPESPDATALRLREDAAKWTAVIRKINLKVD
ncbi:tripartite tricarboxylate transporter substrate binding protein [Achromobacter sp. SD115]|uniref:Bug family tripartite tricarboxylate transporter substrate binding protein n=1 Tax=Achromobacter sp. SD115 TaxID=2782011 RepID=UPI001A96378E|nr:tripartite tricarboxylate transporter substrate binding protein [Achromobacter sp. SD115]MBO1015736.1 tripartite tricarboxylate transporter substrate binding protein [Achromobacter sp. SD115]